MAERMPPPGSGNGKPSVMIAVGVPKPKSGGGDSEGGRMRPPGSEPEGDGSGKASPEEAGVIKEDQRCIDCENYSVDTGECAKVQGTFQPGDSCLRYFSPAHDEENESPEAESAEQETPSLAPSPAGGAY